MAWYLNYTYFAGAKYAAVSIPASTSNVALPLQIEWEIEFEARKNGTEFIVASDSPSTTAALFFIRSGSDFEFRSTGNSNWLVTTGVTTSNWTVYKIRSTFNGTTRTQQLYINGTLTATRNPTTSAVPAINALFGLNNNANRYGDFKYFKFTDFVTPANNRNYDANASGGTGLVLPDTAGGVNGSLDGTWPAGNAQWVFYSSGTNYSLTADGGTFAYIGAAASLLANRSLSANGGSFSYSGASATLRINRLLQIDGASFSYSGASADLLLNRLLSADGGLFSYSGAAATLTYTPITGYVLSADGATFNYVGADAALSYSQNFPEANPNDFTVSSLVDSSFAYTSSVSPTVGFSAMISSTFKYNGSLN